MSKKIDKVVEDLHALMKATCSHSTGSMKFIELKENLKQSLEKVIK